MSTNNIADRSRSLTARDVDLIGKRFGKLFVLRGTSDGRERWGWLCRCDCGQLEVFTVDQLRAGKVHACRFCGPKQDFIKTPASAGGW